MTTLDLRADSPSTHPTDFVSTDAADLASHMDHCAHSRSRFFALRSTLESVHAIAHPRVVTVLLLGAVCLALIFLA